MSRTVSVVLGVLLVLVGSALDRPGPGLDRRKRDVRG